MRHDNCVASQGKRSGARLNVGALSNHLARKDRNPTSKAPVPYSRPRRPCWRMRPSRDSRGIQFAGAYDRGRHLLVCGAGERVPANFGCRCITSSASELEASSPRGATDHSGRPARTRRLKGRSANPRCIGPEQRTPGTCSDCFKQRPAPPSGIIRRAGTNRTTGDVVFQWTAAYSIRYWRRRRRRQFILRLNIPVSANHQSQRQLSAEAST